MAEKLDPYEVAALERSLNSSAERVSTIWISFLVFAVYLAISTGTTTHRQLLLEEPVKLPVLNIDLPLVGFFVLAPTLFVLFHFYVLLQVLLLGRTAAAYNEAADRSVKQPLGNATLRQRLTNTLFAQIFAGSPREREGLIGSLLRMMAWITLAIAPVLLLFLFEVRFLPYHSHFATWLHRFLIFAELFAVISLWPLILNAQNEATWRQFYRQPIAIFSILFAFFVSVCTTTFPGEPHSNLISGKPFLSLDCKPSLFSIPERWFPNAVNHLELPRIWIVDEEKLSKIANASKEAKRKPYESERTKDFSNRDLNCSNFEFADLRFANFRNGQLQNANFRGASLSGADFIDATMDNASFATAKLDGARFEGGNLPNAVFTEVTMRGAQLSRSHLSKSDFQRAQLDESNFDEADLSSTNLDYASLRGSQLRGANLSDVSFYEAVLVDANLGKTTLLGARFGSTADMTRVVLTGTDARDVEFAGARMSGAMLDAANLAGANFSNTNLRGASFDYSLLQSAYFNNASLEGTSFVRALLSGAMLYEARITGANLDGAKIVGATLSKADLRAASIRTSELQGAELGETKLSHARIQSVGLWGATETQCSDAWVTEIDLSPKVGTRPYNEEEMDKRLEEACKDQDECRLHGSSLSHSNFDIPISADESGISLFIEMSVESISEDSRRYARERLKGLLRQKPGGEKAWLACAKAGKSKSLNQQERKIVDDLTKLVCGDTESRLMLAEGIIRNWFSGNDAVQQTLGTAAMKSLSGGLLKCVDPAVLKESSRQRLVGVASNQPTK